MSRKRIAVIAAIVVAVVVFALIEVLTPESCTQYHGPTIGEIGGSTFARGCSDLVPR